VADRPATLSEWAQILRRNIPSFSRQRFRWVDEKGFIRKYRTPLLAIANWLWTVVKLSIVVTIVNSVLHLVIAPEILSKPIIRQALGSIFAAAALYVFATSLIPFLSSYDLKTWQCGSPLRLIRISFLIYLGCWIVCYLTAFLMFFDGAAGPGGVSIVRWEEYTTTQTFVSALLGTALLLFWWPAIPLLRQLKRREGACIEGRGYSRLGATTTASGISSKATTRDHSPGSSRADTHDPLMHYRLALELAANGDTRQAYVEMLRFLRGLQLTTSSPKMLWDAERLARENARQWEAQLGAALLTNLGSKKCLAVRCPNCGAKLKGSVDFIDDVSVCRKCRHEFGLPFADAGLASRPT
jgi:hypothetical protein